MDVFSPSPKRNPQPIFAKKTKIQYFQRKRLVDKVFSARPLYLRECLPVPVSAIAHAHVRTCAKFGTYACTLCAICRAGEVYNEYIQQETKQHTKRNIQV